MSKKFILISYGRSGSSFINSTLADVLDLDYKKIGKELFGSNRKDIKSLDNPLEVADEYYKKHSNDKYLGFQWKPYCLNKKYKKLFNYIKNHNIKIILNYRNPLHIFISQTKHSQNSLKAHYKPDNIESITRAREITVNLSIEELLEFIKKYNKNMSKLEKLLKKKDIPYQKIEYEKLSDKKLPEWLKLFDHLNYDINRDLLEKKIRHSLDNPKYEKTTTKKDNEIIENYSSVKTALIKNNYGDLIV